MGYAATGQARAGFPELGGNHRLVRASPGLDFNRAALVVALTPVEFIAWATGRLRAVEVGGIGPVRLPPPWQPGQHIAAIGKTREGKTNFFVWLLNETRKYVLALDPKGEDESLSASGWARVATVPGGTAKPRWGSAEWRIWRNLDQDRAEGRPVQLIAGIASRTRAADAYNKVLMSDAVEYCRQAGGYTLYVDEHQVFSDRRMYDLGAPIARQAITAARDGVSLITSAQYLAWIEKASARQATMVAMCRTGDKDLIRSAANMAGRPWQMIAAALDELPKFWWLIVPDEQRAPMIMVRAPKVT
jgi:hypothetical protein